MCVLWKNFKNVNDISHVKNWLLLIWKNVNFRLYYVYGKISKCRCQITSMAIPSRCSNILSWNKNGTSVQANLRSFLKVLLSKGNCSGRMTLQICWIVRSMGIFVKRDFASKLSYCMLLWVSKAFKRFINSKVLGDKRF